MSGTKGKTIRQDIRAVESQAGVLTLAEWADALCSVLAGHEAELKGITYSYRLRASDTSFERAFSLMDGRYADLNADVPADADVSGKEADLLLVFERKLPPLKALLTRKIKLKGSKAALIKLGDFL